MNYHSLRHDILPAESLPRLSGGGRFGEFVFLRFILPIRRAFALRKSKNLVVKLTIDCDQKRGHNSNYHICNALARAATTFFIQTQNCNVITVSSNKKFSTLRAERIRKLVFPDIAKIDIF